MTRLYAALLLAIVCVASDATGAITSPRLMVPPQKAAGVGSNHSKLSIPSTALTYIDKNDDSLLPGDYFTGRYYDSALGYFRMDWSADVSRNVKVVAPLSSSQRTALCNGLQGYRLGGHSYSELFGFMTFAYSTDVFVYLCFGTGGLSDGFLGGYAYSPTAGLQAFSHIHFEPVIVANPEAKTLSIKGISTISQKQELEAGQFDSDVKIIGDIGKSKIKATLHKKAFQATANITPSNGDRRVTELSSMQWSNSSGIKLRDKKLLFYRSLAGSTVTVEADTITGNKTLLVIGGNIYVKGNITNASNDSILGLVALEDDAGNGGNIYIDPTVTDLHAIMFAERSVIGFNGTAELSGESNADVLMNQLFIKGSLFSENTIGGGKGDNPQCPFYIAKTNCSVETARKYDLNYLRRYRLVPELDANGIPTGNTVPANGGLRAAVGVDAESYAVIIEYNPTIAGSPPILFDN